MPQGSLYDAEGNLVWEFDICTEFDCNAYHAHRQYGIECGSDFTKEPCVFHEEHKELNLKKPIMVEERE